VLVGGRAVILNNVTGRNDDISSPFVIAVVIEGRFQGRISYCATQVACRVGKQVRIRQVQDPQRL